MKSLDTTWEQRGWNKFECKDGSTYFWKHDDRRLAIRSGENIVWLNLQILQFLEAEMNLSSQAEQLAKGKHYSRKNSIKFWEKINNTGSLRLYSKACKLQNLEDEVLAYIKEKKL